MKARRKFFFLATCVLVLQALPGIPARGRGPAPAQGTGTETAWLEDAGLAGLAIEAGLEELASSPDDARRRQVAANLARLFTEQMLGGDLNGPPVEWPAVGLDQVERLLADPVSPEWQLVRLFARQQQAEETHRVWWRLELDQSATTELKREWQAQLTALGAIIERLEVDVATDEVAESRSAGPGSANAAPTGAGAAGIASSTLLARAICIAVRINSRVAEMGPSETTGIERREAIRLACRLLGLGESPELAVEQLAAIIPQHGWQLALMEDFGTCQTLEEGMIPEPVVVAIGRGFGTGQSAVSRIVILARSSKFEALSRLLDELGGDAGPATLPAGVWHEAVGAWSHMPAESCVAWPGIFWNTALNLVRRDRQGLLELQAALARTGWPASKDDVLAGWIAGEMVLAAIEREKARDRRMAGKTLPAWLTGSRNGATETDPARLGALASEAASRLKAACEGTSQLILPSDRGQMWHSLAVTYRLMDQHRAALDAAHEAERLWFDAGDPRSASAAGLGLESAGELARDGELTGDELGNEAAAIASRHPGTLAGSAARLVLLRQATRGQSAADAARTWRAIVDQQPDAASPRLELLQALVRQFQAASATREPPSDEILPLAESLFALSDAGPAQRIRTISLLVEADQSAFAGMRGRDHSRWLARAERLAGDPDTGDVERGEAYFAVMRLAVKAGARESLNRALTWLAEHPQPWPWHRAALLERLRQLEQEAGSATSASDNSRRELIVTCQRLLDIDGRDSAAFTRSPDARRAGRRLAGLLDLTGQREEAIKLYAALVESFPGDPSLVSEAAGLANRMKKHGEAVRWWRRLGQLSEAGSEDWRAARYNLALTLMETDREEALQVARQTTELDPDMPEGWRERYVELGLR